MKSETLLRDILPDVLIDNFDVVNLTSLTKQWLNFCP